jgi:hypothetical protein
MRGDQKSGRGPINLLEQLCISRRSNRHLAGQVMVPMPCRVCAVTGSRTECGLLFSLRKELAGNHRDRLQLAKTSVTRLRESRTPVADVALRILLSQPKSIASCASSSLQLL